MYNVTRQTYEKYGNVIEITREDSGEFETPFQACNKAFYMKRIWFEEIKTKIRLLVDDKIMSVSQINKWVNDEYKSLPKCESCAKILNGNVYTHNLCNNYLFCSEDCSNENYRIQMEKLSDEEECDYL
jgi:hypothetical protein